VCMSMTETPQKIADRTAIPLRTIQRWLRVAQQGRPTPYSAPGRRRLLNTADTIVSPYPNHFFFANDFYSLFSNWCARRPVGFFKTSRGNYPNYGDVTYQLLQSIALSSGLVSHEKRFVSRFRRLDCSQATVDQGCPRAQRDQTRSFRTSHVGSLLPQPTGICRRDICGPTDDVPSIWL
jgi:hypothetical protein